MLKEEKLAELKLMIENTLKSNLKDPTEQMVANLTNIMMSVANRGFEMGEEHGSLVAMNDIAGMVQNKVAAYRSIRG